VFVKRVSMTVAATLTRITAVLSAALLTQVGVASGARSFGGGAMTRTRSMWNIAAVVAIALLLGGCGSSTDDSRQAPPPSASVVVYDEAVDGPLPFDTSQLSPTALAKITFNLGEGTYIVRGASIVGEHFFVVLDTGFTIQSVTVTYANPIDSNDHVLMISSPRTGVNPLFNVFHMATQGTYTFSVPVPAEFTGPTTLDVYSGSSVSGYTGGDTPFSVALKIVRTAP
jgi:hypothetical protein